MRKLFTIASSPHFKGAEQLGFLWLSLLVLGVLGPLIIDLHPYMLSDTRLATPSWALASGPVFGTDDLGRDLLSRLIYGARTSLGIALAVVFFSMLIGTSLGLLAGVYGGWKDALLMRLVDAVMTIPGILVAIVLVAVLGPGLLNAMVAVSVAAVPRFARVVRSVAALEMKKLYVQAARCCGCSNFKLLYSEVLPNCTGQIIVQASLGISDAILEIAALGFLGLGANPPIAEWGAMLTDARPFIESAPHMVILPGLCIMLTVLSFNVLGDSLRDFLDPKTRSRQWS